MSLGTMKCPDCGREHTPTFSLEEARDLAGMILAAVDGLRPLAIGARGGSDG